VGWVHKVEKPKFDSKLINTREHTQTKKASSKNPDPGLGGGDFQKRLWNGTNGLIISSFLPRHEPGLAGFST
jgi:hypothetical protein